jgi:hypothetical protein
MLTVNGATHAGGVGGRGATANSGNSGGGGGSGGAILLESPSVTLNAGATLVANGGGGGEGSRSQVGGNASDGLEATTRTPGGTGNNGDDGGDGAAAGGGAHSDQRLRLVPAQRDDGEPRGERDGLSAAVS